MITAGSIVVKSDKSNTLVAGVPAKLVRHLSID